MRKNRKIQIATAVLISLFIAACGKKAQAAEAEQETEQEAEQTLPDNVIEVYEIEEAKYVDEVMPAQYTDDLSLLSDMKYANNTYVYQDGKVYYRRYHEDSYEEAALWGNYDDIPETKKEIVCIDAEGGETVLFTDEGYGEIYLIDDRFYMLDAKICEEDGSTHRERHLYSVDMQGNDRIDYGNGKILVVDKERNIIIMQVYEEDNTNYYAMNYVTGEKKVILSDLDDEDDYYSIYVSAYQDGWLYYEKYIAGDDIISKLNAVSYEGEQREIITLMTKFNNYSSYRETILKMEVDRDRIYLIFGGYDGNAQEFQGGKLISVKLDGTDYKAVRTKGDTFYLCHDNERTLVYFPSHLNPVNDPCQDSDMNVWDVEADICCPSEFRQKILRAYDQQAGWMWHYYPEKKGALCGLTLYGDEIKEKEADIYALPDDSGKIVRVAMNLGDKITKRENEEVYKVKYEDLYYADGFLYFTVEYNAYDKETSIGWRDGYRRLYTDIYRLKIGEDKASLLYSY